MDPNAPQRSYKLRGVFNGLRYVLRTGCQWRYLPHDLPPWEVVYQQTQRWMSARVFEAVVHDLRALIRVSLAGKNPEPSAAIMDARTIQSTPESGAQGGYDGAKRKKGRKVVERTFTGLARFRRLARDYERLDQTLKGLHFVAAVILMLAQVFALGSA
jgi:transposase